ncbi:kinesin heavy chain isoform X1 [Parasteatoda tepidariorum]|uniref:kinesin heavy chain isoform X1 n=1 Tax=Parasteatoda tepidariorum TaxID=114398 RepID=UPI0039BC4BC7
MATSQKIKVVCRIRRKAEDEEDSTENGYTFPDDKSLLHTSSGKVYTFDKLFGANASQLEVYNDVAKPIVTGVFNGFNGTILAYGQTSSGKTYTMEGDVTNEEKYGIIPRVAQDIFNRTESLQNSKYEIKISFYEIYLEKIRDLFNDSQKANLKVYDDKKSLPFIVGGKEISVTNVNEIMDLFTKAKLKRHVAATDMNELSSRSHTIFQIVIKQENFTTRKKLIGKLLLVDLAGSEKVSHKDQVDSTVKRESTHINKSLSALTRVISLLSEGSKAVVFYRDSLLTRLLKESLGGNSQTAIIVCVDPSFENETKLSLDFGNRAKVIQNNIHLNEKYCGSKLSRFLGRFLPKNDVYLKEFVSELKRWRNGKFFFLLICYFDLCIFMIYQ